MNRLNRIVRFASVLVALGACAAASIGATYRGLPSPRYGNWGGLNYSDGRDNGSAFGSAVAVDALDALCRTHDRAHETADRYYRPRYQQATSYWERGRVYADWSAAYDRANSALVSGAANLRPLAIYPNGSLRLDSSGKDSWGGRNIPASPAFREGFRLGTIITLLRTPQP